MPNNDAVQEKTDITVGGGVANVTAKKERSTITVANAVGVAGGTLKLNVYGTTVEVPVSASADANTVADAIRTAITNANAATVVAGGANVVTIEAKENGDMEQPTELQPVGGVVLGFATAQQGSTDRANITVKIHGNEYTVEVINGQTEETIAQNIATAAGGEVDGLNNKKVNFVSPEKKAYTDATVDSSAVAGTTFTVSVSQQGVNMTFAAQANKITVKVYKDSISGVGLGQAVFAAGTPMAIDIDPVEITDGSSAKFYVVLEGTTIPANTTPNTELQLTNVEYLDVLDNGTNTITTMSSYDQGLPLKWTNK